MQKKLNFEITKRDYSMETVHKWVLLFQKKINVWAQWTSDFFDQHNMWIKVVQALSTVWWFEV